MWAYIYFTLLNWKESVIAWVNDVKFEIYKWVRGEK